MLKRGITQKTQIKIKNYLLYSSKVDQAFLNEQAKQIIDQFPETLREEIQQETHTKIIDKWPLF